MARIYTEFRIAHKTVEEKETYERKVDEALKRAGYKTRVEFINEKIRELLNKNNLIKEGDIVVNKHTRKIYKVIQVRKEDNIVIVENEHETRAFGEELTYTVNDLEIIESDK